MNSYTALNAILRTDFKLFYQRSFAELNPAIDYQDNWHMDAIIHVLNGVISGDIRRLIINMPPRYGKSLATTVALTAYLLGLDPSKRIITACYAHSLAEKLSLECRRLMAAPFYCNAFPDLKIGEGKNAVTHFETTAGGFRYATSLGGAVTGMGADLLIVDDLMKASVLPSENELDSASDFLQGTLFSRLNDKVNGQIVIVSQRLHEDDPPGRLIAKGGWHVLSLPAIAEHDADTPVGPLQDTPPQEGRGCCTRSVSRSMCSSSSERTLGTAGVWRAVPAGPNPRRRRGARMAVVPTLSQRCPMAARALSSSSAGIPRWSSPTVAAVIPFARPGAASETTTTSSTSGGIRQAQLRAAP